MAGRSPNLLVIQTDQQSYWTLGCYGGTVVHTPNIDRLASEGAIFSSFFTVTAMCTPSRGCLVTGRYPEDHGAYINNVAMNRDEITFAEVLRRQGYETGFAGKWHLDGTPHPGFVHPERGMGFRRVQYMFNRGHWSKMENGRYEGMQPRVYGPPAMGDEHSYTTDFLTGKTIEFIDDYGDRPFCFMLSIPDPHPPDGVRQPYDTLFSPEDMPIPATFWQEDMPDWARNLQRRSRFGMGKVDREQQLRRFLALYFGKIKLIDDSVGRIIEKLESKGLLENTLLVFTSDHGDYAGEHGLHGKNNLYESVYRIPLILHWPNGIEAGTCVDSVMSNVDFQPTVLSLMGMPASGREQGCDRSQALIEDESNPDDCAFLHHSSHERAGIFTREFELVLVKEAESILFDRINDPYQTNNLFYDSAYREVVHALAGRIIKHHRSHGHPAAEWLASVCPAR